MSIYPSKKWAKDLNMHFSKEGMHMANRYANRCAALLIIRDMNRNHSIASHLLAWPSSKRQSSRGKSLNKRELLVTMGGKLIHPLLTIVEKFLKNIESRTTIWSSNPTSGYTSKGNEIDICTPVFIAASITTAKTRKQPVSTTSSYETILRDTELEDTVIILLAKCRGCEIQREHEVSYGI